MANYKLWTETEEDTLKEIISENPDNLSKAFNIAEKRIGRSSNACSFKWHNKLKHHSEIISTNGKEIKFVNRKNNRRIIKQEDDAVVMLDFLFNELDCDQKKSFIVKSISSLVN